MQPKTARLRPVSRDTIDDPELLEVLDRADRLSAPKPEWYLATAHYAEGCKVFDRYWDTVFRHGRVDHSIKELMRLAIVQLLGCDFCSSQRSAIAQGAGLSEHDVEACTMTDFNPPDPRLRAALSLARQLCLSRAGDDTAVFDPIYKQLHEVFDEEEIVELLYLSAITIGGTTVARSLDLT